MDASARFPRAWHGVVYGAVVWVPVVLSLIENVRDGISGDWPIVDWVLTLVIWAVGCFLWMCICDWMVTRLGRARGWWA